MGSIPQQLPYWQDNVPEDQRTEECPEFLQDCDAKVARILATPDSEYQLMTWPVICEKIRNNQLNDFMRIPSEQRRYKAYVWNLKRTHRGVMSFVRKERLHWNDPIVPKGSAPFECEDDMKITWNDWPYGFEEKVVHLVVWTKFPFEEDPKTADLADKARAGIQAYVRKVFLSRMPKEHVSHHVKLVE